MKLLRTRLWCWYDIVFLKWSALSLTGEDLDTRIQYGSDCLLTNRRAVRQEGPCLLT